MPLTNPLTFFCQVELWRKFINFEKSNPLRSEDTGLVSRRVMFSTEQCILVLTHHPAVWHQAAQYLDQTAKLLTEKAVRIITIKPFNLFCFRSIYKCNCDNGNCRDTVIGFKFNCSTNGYDNKLISNNILYQRIFNCCLILVI